MKLYEGDLYWQPIEFNLEEFDENISCDCLIVGAGITGLLVANKLQKQGYKTIVVDREGIGLGLTISSMGTIEIFNKEDLEALKELEKIIKDIPDNLGFKKQKSLTINKDISTIDEAIDYREVLAEELKNNYGISQKEAVLTYKSYVINQHRFAINLAKNFIKEGGKIYKGNYIKQSFNYAYFDNEARIKYKNLILATGFEILIENKINDVYHKIQYTIISEPIENLEHSDLIITVPDRPMMQIRTTHDHRLMITGNETYSMKYGFQEMFVKAKQLFYDFYRLMPKYRTINIEMEYAAIVPTTHSNKHHITRTNNIYYLYPFDNNAILSGIKISNELVQELNKNHFD